MITIEILQLAVSLEVFPSFREGFLSNCLLDTVRVFWTEIKSRCGHCDRLWDWYGRVRRTISFQNPINDKILIFKTELSWRKIRMSIFRLYLSLSLPPPLLLEFCLKLLCEIQSPKMRSRMVWFWFKKNMPSQDTSKWWFLLTISMREMGMFPNQKWAHCLHLYTGSLSDVRRGFKKFHKCIINVYKCMLTNFSIFICPDRNF